MTEGWISYSSKFIESNLSDKTKRRSNLICFMFPPYDRSPKMSPAILINPPQSLQCYDLRFGSFSFILYCYCVSPIYYSQHYIGSPYLTPPTML